jgi:hypothetical protein
MPGVHEALTKDLMNERINEWTGVSPLASQLASLLLCGVEVFLMSQALLYALHTY